MVVAISSGEGWARPQETLVRCLFIMTVRLAPLKEGNVRISRHGSSMVWKRALGELVLIVGGVLIALALDSWREGRHETQQEVAYLEQLLLDLRETEERLQLSIAGDTEYLDEVNWLLDRAFRGPPPPADSLGVPTGYSEFRPLTGTQVALVEGGDLRLLRSDSIRFELIAYSALIDATETVLRHTETLIWNSTDRLIYSQARHSQFAAAFGSTKTGGGQAIDVAAALNDPDLVAALQAHVAASRNRIASLRLLEEPLSNLIRLVEAELELR